MKHKLLAMTAVIVCLLTLAAWVGSAQPEPSNRLSLSVPISDMEQAKVQQVTDNQAVINIGESPQGGNPGEPLLPYKQVCLLVPPDADLGTVSAGLISEGWEELAGECEIAAVKPAATWDGEKFIISWGKDPSRIVDGRDSDIYSSDAYFPGKPVEVVSVGRFRQWKLVELRVWLAAYNPVQKKVRTLKDTQAVLSVEKLSAAKAVGLESKVLPVLPNTEKFLPALRSKIANPQDIETFYGQQAAGLAASGGPAPSAPGTIPADYVIITTNQIVANSIQLANFIAAKQAAGFTVKTVTEGGMGGDLTYMTGGTCDQRADNIRSWLVNYWAGDGIQYVLLIGDPDPGNFNFGTSVPMKMCWPRSGAASDQQAPSDMYFGELSGNWDLNWNGSFGEFSGDYGAGGADKYCELKVGRIPFYGNYVDLDNILSNSISYDTANANLGYRMYRRKVLVPAAISNFAPQDNNGDGDAIDPGDYAAGWRTFGDDWGETIKALASSISFAPYTLYEKQGVYVNGSAYPLTACNANLTNANILNEWKNRYGFVTWWAHGLATSSSQMQWTTDNQFVGITGNLAPHLETNWPTMVQSPDFSLANWGIWHGYYSPAFVVAISCNNGTPENNNNLGYAMINGPAAIGTISGTRVTWYNLGSWNTGVGFNNGDNASYGYYCFDRMANYNEDIGTALVVCRSNFGTAWAGGESWMNMIEFTIYGDPSLALDAPDIIKWEQLPDTTENGMDIRCDRNDGTPRILADDFLCTTTGPITQVTLWGSWLNDIKGVIGRIHLSIHSDDPCGPSGWSEPNELLWSQDFNSADFAETLYMDAYGEWWWDPYKPDWPVFPGDHQIWQYDINIPSGGFTQQGDPCRAVIYWLDAYVELDMNLSPPDANFGWKTSYQHWNDDAVYAYDLEPIFWNELRYPWPHPNEPCSIDLAFRIWTEVTPQSQQPKESVRHLKWSQPPIEINPGAEYTSFCGWDEKSYNANESSPLGSVRIVADDFRCLGTMPVTSIHWWGSYFGWEQPVGLPAVQPDGWWFGFWSNQPQGPYPYSYPKKLLHAFFVYDPNRVQIEKVGTDQYYDYYNYFPSDTCYQYTVNLDPEEVFRQNDFVGQTQDNVFWLSIVAMYNEPCEPNYPWGWKTRQWGWMDDAVTFNLTGIPGPNFTTTPEDINEIRDPRFNDSMDVSFELDTDPNYIKWEQDFNGISNWPHYEDVNSTINMMEPYNERLVADDWQCLRRTPVTAIVWWGSYIGYKYEACGYTFMPLPVPPNRFRLTIWTDVPAGADPLYAYSHPGRVIWEYDALVYDEVLVGFDKHPEQISPLHTEPVFRYSVRLPQEQWFHQPDYNEVFWLSVQAIYDVNLPNYLWGWTNHQHVFNDDAVQGYMDWESGLWFWKELYDQTDASEDMSFVLFTDPNGCSTCANYNLDASVNFLDYAEFANEWYWSGPAGGYNNGDLDCDGNVDLYDLDIFCQQWLTYCP